MTYLWDNMCKKVYFLKSKNNFILFASLPVLLNFHNHQDLFESRRLSSHLEIQDLTPKIWYSNTGYIWNAMNTKNSHWYCCILLGLVVFLLLHM